MVKIKKDTQEIRHHKQRETKTADHTKDPYIGMIEQEI